MSDALELALVLLACTTPILAIMGMSHYINHLKQRGKQMDDRAEAAARNTTRELAELRQRIEVLETIITDKGYQLDQELRALGRQVRG